MFDSKLTADQLNALGPNTLGEQLGIRFTEVGNDYLKAKMPVDHRTKQPFGYLHGGASVALAETLGSVASYAYVNGEYNCMGLEINANHIKGVKEGYVYGIVKAIHLGKSTHVWDIQITNEQDQLVCVSRITMAILKKK